MSTTARIAVVVRSNWQDCPALSWWEPNNFVGVDRLGPDYLTIERGFLRLPVFVLFLLSRLFVFVLLVIPCSAVEFSRLVVFGDSLSDAGNVFHLSDGALVGPPNFEGRWSDGPVWVEQLATRMGIDPPQASLAGGTNYAFSGAVTGQGTAPSNGVEIPRLGEQIGSFLTAGGGVAPDDLIIVWIGHNDRSRGIGETTIFSNITEHLETLHGNGARSVLVPNIIIPPAVLFPSQQQAADSVISFNRKLDAYLGRFVGQHDLDIYRLDLTPVYNELYLNPADFGIEVTGATAYQVGSGFVDERPERFIWWDDNSFHPSSTTHGVIADAAFELLMDGPSPLRFGDVDGDLTLTVQDISQICRPHRRYNFLYDLNNDGANSIDDAAVFLEEAGSLPGDSNLDGTVDFSDFLSMSDRFGERTRRWSSGNFDCNDWVDFEDFVILKDNFGRSVMKARSVPEASTSSLLVIGILTLVQRGPRSRDIQGHATPK